MGLEMILDYTTDLFNLDVSGLTIDRNGIGAIDWINECQEKMLVRFEFTENPYYVYDPSEDEALDYVLRNARASEHCILKSKFSEHFRFDGKLGPVNHLLIEPFGHWVTLNNLINFDALSILQDKFFKNESGRE
ncbi:unnamed protein product [Caenorhabditis nigoni]